MKNKRLFLIGIIVVFSMVIIALVFYAFTIKRVDVYYSYSEREGDTVKIEKELSKLKGANIFFTSYNDVENLVDEFSFFEIEKIEKSYPSKITVRLKERRRAYYIEKDDVNLVLNEDGVVLEKNSENVSSLCKLDLEGNIENFIDNISVLEYNLGQKIKTSNDSYFFKVLSFSKNVDCLDKVHCIHICSKEILSSFDIEYYTNTDVLIHIPEANDLGLEKVKLAFEKYDNEELDYKKSSDSDKIYVFLLNGKLVAQFISKI